MNQILFRLRRLPQDQSGQVLPIMTCMLLVMLGMAALSVDVGRALYGQRELQAATDAAALAGAETLLTATNSTQVVGAGGVGGVVGQYSSISTGYNYRSTVPNATESATLKCLTSLEALGQPCIGSVPYNAVQVTQTAIMPMYFAGLLGHRTLTVSAISTASARGGSPRPSNVAVIVDTTLSMNTNDTNCSNGSGNTLTQMQCALNGVQILLKGLQPCGLNQSTCSPTNGVAVNSFDRVSLFTFPDVSTTTAYLDANCTTAVPNPTSQNNYWNSVAVGLNLSNFNFTMPMGPPPLYSTNPAVVPWGGLPTAMAYSFPVAGASSYSSANTYNVGGTVAAATYQVTGYLSDYRTSDSATTLNPSSTLSIAAGAVSGCNGMAPPNYDGVYGTYYAGVIYAAQATLVAQQAANPGSENVIILISDGDATAGQSTGSNGQKNGMNGSYQVLPNNGNGVTNGANASGNYPSWNQECAQAVTAAQYATSQGTLFYTVAYGSPSVGCVSDTNPTISPCYAMAAMASSPEQFFSDYQQSGSGSTCVASQPVVSLSDIFAAIAADLTQARLIPNNTP